MNLGFADKIMYWDDADGGSDVVSNDVRTMLTPLAGALDAFFESQNKLMAQPPKPVEPPKIDNRVSADALMSRLNLIVH